MKKKSTKKTRFPLPKNKRFHKFFLRRFFLCLLAGVTVTAVLFQKEYVDDSNSYNENTLSFWNGKLTETESLIKKNRMQFSADFACKMSGIDSSAPYTDQAVILTCPERSEYYVSENEVIFLTLPADETKYYATSDLANQIVSSVVNESKQFTFAERILENTWLSQHTNLLQSLGDKLIYRDTPYRIHVNDDSVCTVEYGWLNFEDHFKSLHTLESKPGDGREITNQYCTLTDSTSNDNGTDPDSETLLPKMVILGCSTDSDSRKTADMIADTFENDRLAKLSERVRYYQDILADTSGKKRKAYIKDMEASTPEDAVFDTPEEILESLQDALSSNFKSFPDELTRSTDNPFNPDCDTHTSFHTYGSIKLEVNGEEWYLHYFEHLDYLGYKLPEYIVTTVHALLCAILLALIWSVIAFLRFRYKYEMDEYRRSLTATLAHDLKSPLMAISSYAENLVNHVYPEKNEHYYKSIMDTTKYMDNIIVNVLELSRLEKSGSVKREKIDVIALTNEVLSLMQDSISERNLHVEVSGSIVMKAERQMMTLAIRNLLDNAIKYTPADGHITVTGQKKTFSVINDMEEESIDDAQQLCEAFVKGDAARSNRSGTGLGLSIVQQIARLNCLKMAVEGKAHLFRVTMH